MADKKIHLANALDGLENIIPSVKELALEEKNGGSAKHALALILAAQKILKEENHD